jgi:hypothetical protein
MDLFIAHWGKEFIRDLITMAQIRIQVIKDGAREQRFRASDREELRQLLIKNKIVTRNTKYVYAEVFLMSASDIYALKLYNGSSKTLIHFDMTDALKRAVFSDEEVVA